MKIVLSELTPVEYNPRELTEEKLGRLMTSIKAHTKAVDGWDPEEGFRLLSSLCLNRQGKRIVGGNQRVLALQRLGQTWVHDDDVNWVDVSPNSPEEKAINIALNSLDAQGEFKWDTLADVLQELEKEGYDLSQTALASYTIEPLLAADWKPPTLPPASPPGNNDIGEPIPVTKEQRVVIEKAIEAAREITEDDDVVSEGQCVEWICKKFLETVPHDDNPPSVPS